MKERQSPDSSATQGTQQGLRGPASWAMIWEVQDLWGKESIGRKRSRSSKNGPGLLKVPQNSAEPLGFCRKVLQEGSHSKMFVEERFCRTLVAKPSFSGPCKFFSKHTRERTLLKYFGHCLGAPNPHNFSQKYCSTPPICTAIHPQFVSLFLPCF